MTTGPVGGLPAGGVRVRTPAKVNLVLGVGPIRSDGFHELDTLFYAVDLGDTVDALPAPRGTVELRITGDLPGVRRLPIDERNLATRAARLLADRHRPERGVRLRVHKAIPVAGGLAGGSSDAAGTLVACAALWRLELGTDDLLPLAAELGSDVPFCLLGGAAHGSGRGERLRPVRVGGEQHWILVLADRGLSTPAMFRALDLARAGADEPVCGSRVPDDLLTALAIGHPSRIAEHLVNDLQDVALAARPDLRATLDVARRTGAAGALVSGSGPTVAVLAHDADRADRLAATLRSAGVGRTVIQTTGPAPGAHLVAESSPR